VWRDPQAERRVLSVSSFNLVAAPPQASESGWPFSYMRATMTTIRQFMQTSPVKAMELFTKLLDTSDNAIKTRERLFGQLKDELELAAKLEEQHLFPVLRKQRP
jgi:hypothetical protein